VAGFITLPRYLGILGVVIDFDELGCGRQSCTALGFICIATYSLGCGTVVRDSSQNYGQLVIFFLVEEEAQT